MCVDPGVFLCSVYIIAVFVCVDLGETGGLCVCGSFGEMVVYSSASFV